MGRKESKQQVHWLVNKYIDIPYDLYLFVLYALARDQPSADREHWGSVTIEDVSLNSIVAMKEALLLHFHQAQSLSLQFS